MMKNFLKKLFGRNESVPPPSPASVVKNYAEVPKTMEAPPVIMEPKVKKVTETPKKKTTPKKPAPKRTKK